MASPDRFLHKIRSALGHSARPARELDSIFYPGGPEADRKWTLISGRNRSERLELLQRLVQAAAELDVAVHSVRDPSRAGAAVAELVRSRTPEWSDRKAVCMWKDPDLQRMDLAERLLQDGIPVHTTEPGTRGVNLRGRIAASFIGVTSADFCIAETATLVMKTRPGQPRSVSLVPSIHIAVLDVGRIIRNLGELYLLLQHDPAQRAEGLTRCMTLVSGASSTRDIEGFMVRGAHGPCEVHLVVITG